MSAPAIDNTPWVFVSHASADLAQVRQVRNFMEEHGAAPLLFHLKALNEPERFWPLIEEEIAARNFFLLCNSEAARKSAWVQRERELVRKISEERGIRVGSIDLNDGPPDFAGLQRFLLNLQVFIVGDDRGQAHAILRSFGYGLLGGVNFSQAGLKCLGDGSPMSDDMLDQLNYGATRGWLLVILSQLMADSDNFWRELPRPSPQERVMFVLPRTVTLPSNAPPLPADFLVHETDSFERALTAAAQRMLSVGPG